MNVGDQVIVTAEGEVRIIPQGGDEDAGGGDVRVVGRIIELRDAPDDTIVEVPPPEPNQAPGLTTLGTLRKQYL